MKLTVLGCNGPFPATGGATSGYLVQAGETCIQLDMGSGVLSALTGYTAPETLTALILSHWHYDHACDVLPLLYRLEAMGKPLHIYAPVDEKSPIRQAVMQCSMVTLHDIAPGDELNLNGVQVQVFKARHPVPAVMLRLTNGASTLCYTGDTNTVEGLETFAQGADLLLADGLFTTDLWVENKPHLSAAQAAQLAKDAGAAQVIITHTNPTIDPETLLKEARSVRQDAKLAERFRCYQV